MARATLTAANSILMIAIPELFPAPVQIQGYATDDVFSSEPVDSVETMMGVDGLLSGGWVSTPKRMSITLQADSPSIVVFDAWQQAQEAIRDAYIADGVLTYPSLGRIYTMTKGFMTNYMFMPDAGKTLKPRRFTITWETILGAPI